MEAKGRTPTNQGPVVQGGIESGQMHSLVHFQLSRTKRLTEFSKIKIELVSLEASRSKESLFNFNCKNVCANEGTLKTHLMLTYCKINSYFCQQCEYHKQGSGGIAGGRSYKCIQCDFVFDRARNLKTHLKSNTVKCANTINVTFIIFKPGM